MMETLTAWLLSEVVVDECYLMSRLDYASCWHLERRLLMKICSVTSI